MKMTCLRRASLLSSQKADLEVRSPEGAGLDWTRGGAADVDLAFAPFPPRGGICQKKVRVARQVGCPPQSNLPDRDSMTMKLARAGACLHAIYIFAMKKKSVCSQGQAPNTNVALV